MEDNPWSWAGEYGSRATNSFKNLFESMTGYSSTQLARSQYAKGNYISAAGYTMAAVGEAAQTFLMFGAPVGGMVGTVERGVVARYGEVGASKIQYGSLRSPSELMSVEPASQELLTAVGNKRSLIIAQPGSDELRMLDYFGAEASVGGVNNSSILLRQNPSKAAVLEEFLHGTQARIGVVDRLGSSGLGSAETHVKDFMIRHQKMLGLSNEDIRVLQMLRDKGL
jgi:hypothetical protein